MQEMLEAIADPNRRIILDLLKSGEKTVGEIGQHLNISGASLSHHLTKLKSANLVIARRQGQSIYYSIHTSVFEDLAQAVIGFLGKKEQNKKERKST